MTAGARHVRVAVDAVADRPERTYTYLAPGDEPVPAPGSLLLVPYGRRLALGYALDGSPEPADADLSLVEAVVSAPMLTPDLLALAEEIAAYYRAPIGTTLAAMLPAGLESRIERRWDLLQPDDLPAGLADIADADGGDFRCRPSAARAAPRKERLGRAAPPRGRDPSPSGRSARLRSSPGASACSGRLPAGPSHHGARRSSAPCSPRWDRGADAAGARGVPRDRARGAPAGRSAPRCSRRRRAGLAHRRARPARASIHRHAIAHELADEQVAALDAIAALPGGGELLLEGVAASGKTDVYLAAIQEALDAGLSSHRARPGDEPRPADGRPRARRRRRGARGPALGTLGGERHDEWWRILRGEARVVVGTRTAAFAPVADSVSSSSTRPTTAATSPTAPHATTDGGSLAGGRRSAAPAWCWAPRPPTS